MTMLGIRLTEQEDRRLARHASDTGRPKSALARAWIMERLERESVDEKIRVAAKLLFSEAPPVSDALNAAYFAALDAEDGGYDWGPEGPPEPL